MVDRPERRVLEDLVSANHIERIGRNITNLGKLKAKGYSAGSSNWKSPREYRIFTYNQSGFKLNHKSEPNGQGIFYLSKIGEIPIRLHRDTLENADMKEVTMKDEPTAAWYASFCIDVDEPEKPLIESLSVDDCVGIDLGVINHTHDSRDVVADWLEV